LFTERFLRLSVALGKNNSGDKSWDYPPPYLRFLLVVLLFITRIHVDLPLFAHTFTKPLSFNCLTLPRFPWRWSLKKEAFAHDKITNHNNLKDNLEALKNIKPVILPATGGLCTNGATEFTLKEGIPGNTATTGPTPWQLPIWAHVSTRANFNTGTNLHTGALL